MQYHEDGVHCSMTATSHARKLGGHPSTSTTCVSAETAASAHTPSIQKAAKKPSRVVSRMDSVSTACDEVSRMFSVDDQIVPPPTGPRSFGKSVRKTTSSLPQCEWGSVPTRLSMQSSELSFARLVESIFLKNSLSLPTAGIPV